MNPYFLFPFLFELGYDWISIGMGKKDLHWGWRLPMFILTAVNWDVSTLQNLNLQTGNILLCMVPYCLFDIILNWLRGKKWYYLSSTNKKYWDRNLVRINPYFLLVVRFVCASLIIWMVL